MPVSCWFILFWEDAYWAAIVNFADGLPGRNSGFVCSPSVYLFKHLNFSTF